MSDTVILCCFTSLDDLKPKDQTYENVKALALKAGRFSVFDAHNSRMGDLLTRLMRDPEIEKVEMGFPWTGVKLRELPKETDHD